MSDELFYSPLQPGCLYHIYNRGNNHENIFYNSNNYAYFLLKLRQYLSSCITFYAYCLLPNHFHLFVQVKHEVGLSEVPFTNKKSKQPLSTEQLISESFRRFFMSYAKAINKQQKRTGRLFQKNFKRKLISIQESRCAVIAYIHTNAVHHGLTKIYHQYPYSSYPLLLSDRAGWLDRQSVMEWFGSESEFIKYHEEYVKGMNSARDFPSF
jgi:REP element-mobilizing transposase RayT